MNTFDNVVYTVGDLAAAKRIHTTLLGTEPHTDSPYYVGYHVDGVEIGLAPASPDASKQPVAHIRVADLDATLADVQKAGATLLDAPRDVGGGTLVATIGDPDGTVLGLIQRG
ncbi:MAG TPA: VOC family protein [Baekduia sp.]|uniref:VOC family protein n=1 Tax=Baekduia sp. TaxID=2600305 RepID=UPI002D77D115|nr:VOC family protein [Baekduia sp.]HET6509995.1 VOC family protein [Baekduia sp.]